ncbi:hypothetical protein JTE90_004791 [Oedothorax gibbosus]|uniref:Uncharacterized protein n=1 Tax=Oedothorax gibbosus TaxID=931172 RepID=A0AAV6VID8_9ARAC|nr:hypothetical protein JTE90_004791 [Oedothorax gibbosus]
MDFGNYKHLDYKLKMIAAEFNSKLQFDFSKFIFLGLRGETTKGLEDVVKMAASRDGYEGHKIFSYREKTICHFYIQFRNATCAEKAIMYFRAMDNKFNADIVKNILLTWYMVEKVLDATDEWTTTYVDTTEKYEPSTPLSTKKVRYLLHAFGCNRVGGSLEGSPKYIQAYFPTMAEALAATIALGRWYHYKDLVRNQPGYRVRIVGKDKEARIMDYSGSPSHEAFEMDYFMPALELEGEAEVQKNTIFSQLMS